MSIIEDALSRVRKEGETTSPLDDEFDNLSPDLNHGGASGPSPMRRVGAFALVMCLVAGALWLWLDTLDKKNVQEARAQAGKISDNPLGLSLSTLQKKEKQPEISQKEMVPTHPDDTNNLSLERDDPFVEPTGVEKAVKEETIAQEEEEPVVVEAVAAPTTTPVPEATPKPVATEHTKEPVPTTPRVRDSAPSAPVVVAHDEAFWISDGRVAFEAGDDETALALWKEGFATQQGNGLVFIISAYSQRDAALSKLKQVGDESSAFVLDGFLNGARGYWLLAMPTEDNRTTAQKKIAAALNLSTVKGNDLVKARKKLARHKDKKPVRLAAKSLSKKSGAKTQKISPRQKRREAFVGSLASRASSDIARAEKMVIHGSYQEAVTLLQPHFKTPFSNGKAYLVLGAAYLGLKKYDLANKYLDEGLAINGSEPRLWLQKALVAQERSRHKNALSYLTEADRLDPGRPEVQLGLGYSYDALGQKTRAANAYRNFLGLTERDNRYLTLRQSVVRRLTRLGF